MREGRIGERASIERLLKRESAKLSQGKVRIFAAAACFFDDDEDLLFLFPAPLLRRLFLPPFLSLTHTPPRFQNALSIKNANKKQQPQSTTASRAASARPSRGSVLQKRCVMPISSANIISQPRKMWLGHCAS